MIMAPRSIPLVLASVVAPALFAEEPLTLDPVEVSVPLPSDALLGRPAPITAYSGEFLTTTGVSSYGELAPFVPGFFVSPQSVDNTSVNLRGLTTDAGDPRVQSRVPVFQDGVIISSPRGTAALFDVQGVEVVKGPQATTFGRGVQNGALSFTSNPARAETSGSFTAGFGDDNARLAEGHYNVPIVPEKLFFRAAFRLEQNDGHVDNLVPGAESLQGVDTLAFRASLRWQPAPDTTADLIVNVQRDTPPGVAFKSMVIPTSRGDTDPFSSAELNRGDDLGLDRDLWSVTAIIRHRLGPAWEVVSTTSTREVDSLHEIDADGSGLYLFEFAEHVTDHQFSQDIRFHYDNGGALTGMIGAGMLWSEGREDVLMRTDENVLYSTFTGLPSPGLLPYYEESFSNRGSLFAGDVFGRVDYKLTSKLTFGGGLRLTREHIQSSYRVYNAPVPGNLGAILGGGLTGNNVFAPTAGTLETEKYYNSWSGQIDARYAFTPRHHAYASVGRGRRSPVLTFDPSTQVRTELAEERVWNYEIGFKGANASRRVQYSVSAFHYDYDSFQTESFVGLVPVTVDGGRARGQGLELALQGAINPRLSVFATYGFTDTEFASRDDDGQPQAYAGNSFRLTSRHALTVGGTVLLPAGERGSVFITPIVQYRSEQFFEDDNAAFGGQLRQAGYTLVNLRFGYRPHNGRWDVTAFVNNVFDKEYLIDAGNIGLAYNLATANRGAPRTCGIQATVRF